MCKSKKMEISRLTYPVQSLRGVLWSRNRLLQTCCIKEERRKKKKRLTNGRDSRRELWAFLNFLPSWFTCDKWVTRKCTLLGWKSDQNKKKKHHLGGTLEDLSSSGRGSTWSVDDKLNTQDPCKKKFGGEADFWSAAGTWRSLRNTEAGVKGMQNIIIKDVQGRVKKGNGLATWDHRRDLTEEK